MEHTPEGPDPQWDRARWYAPRCGGRDASNAGFCRGRDIRSRWSIGQVQPVLIAVQVAGALSGLVSRNGDTSSGTGVDSSPAIQRFVHPGAAARVAGFPKLDVTGEPLVHRRVAAVAAYLHRAGQAGRL